MSEPSRDPTGQRHNRPARLVIAAIALLCFGLYAVSPWGFYLGSTAPDYAVITTSALLAVWGVASVPTPAHGTSRWPRRRRRAGSVFVTALIAAMVITPLPKPPDPGLWPVADDLASWIWLICLGSGLLWSWAMAAARAAPARSGPFQDQLTPGSHPAALGDPASPIIPWRQYRVARRAAYLHLLPEHLGDRGPGGVH